LSARKPGGFVGRAVLRREDQRLLLGKGQYVADIALPDMLHVVFVRSTLPHARVKSVDLARCLAAPGVVCALSGADVLAELPPVADNQVRLPQKWRVAIPHTILNPQQPLLATDKVRHVGEALAVIVAESRYAAEDAAELAQVELEPLPPVMDPEAAARPGSPVLHEQFDSNLLGVMTLAKGDAKAALAAAPRRMKKRFTHHRYAAVPMETRGVVSQYEPRTDSITIWSSTQVVHWVRREVATTLGLPEARVRCIAPDVGGGFGVKGHVYPEDLLLPFLARKLQRPVRWIETRSEHFLAACHSRDQIHDVEIGFDDEGRILAMHDRIVMDCGAWVPLGVAPAYNTASHLMGPYKFPHLLAEVQGVATNKVPNAPYRGAGRPEAVQATERLMDLVANELGLEPAEVRRRNMIRADEMPYSAGYPYRDGEPVVYDSGDYPGALAKALAALGGVEAFRKRQAEARKAGRYLGLGIGCYTEGTGAGPFEGATVRIDPSGKLQVCTGACPQGQGMETVYAQIVADLWAVDIEDVTVSVGDTAAIQMGFGTIASRSTVNVSGAIHHASERLKKKVFAIGAHLLECSAADLELREGGVGIAGVPGAFLKLQKIARAARPEWDSGRPPGMEAGLEDTFYFEPPTVTWAYASHAVIVEVDIESGRVRLERYVIAHDCGVVVNPLLAEAQIVGGAVQGIGGALIESLAYDGEGQLLTGSLMDYALPIASQVPDIEVIHQEIPSPLNPLGVKGLGEGGAISPPVAIANAVCDALSPFGVEINSTPVKPAEIVRLVGAARAAGRA
jgi:aerobic carbon-monoxide dehydrogenase large subunit